MTGVHNEFEIISEYFASRHHHRQDVTLGIGDDASLCRPPDNSELAISVDTLISGVHFPTDAEPSDIGWKALAVNLSDMAAMGATPAWMTLALTIPKADSNWLNAFCQGLFELADLFSVDLIGGDTTRGNLTISIQIIGFVPFGQALCRNNAQVGDSIYVTGTLGDAALGLKVCLENETLPSVSDDNYVRRRLNRPTPRVSSGLALRHIANSAIDISDGLQADLGHILAASGVGACINIDALPLSSTLRKQSNESEIRQLALTAGDDYELCFTVSPEFETELLSIEFEHPITRIGTIERQTNLRYINVEGQTIESAQGGYRHF
ncbi:MAG: thiamine-phosphate kinase [Pseudomonadota bacterium]